MENSDEPAKATPEADEPGEQSPDVQMEEEETRSAVASNNSERAKEDSNDKIDEDTSSTNEQCSSSIDTSKDCVVSQNQDGDSEEVKAADSLPLAFSPDRSSEKSLEQDVGGTNDENLEQQSTEEVVQEHQSPVLSETEANIDEEVKPLKDENDKIETKDVEEANFKQKIELPKEEFKNVQRTEETKFEAKITIEEKKSDDSDSDEENVVELSSTKRRKEKNRRVIVDWVCVNPDCTRDGKSNPEVVSTARPFVLGHFGNTLLS